MASDKPDNILPALIVVEELSGTLSLYDFNGHQKGQIYIGSKPHEILLHKSKNRLLAFISVFGLSDYDNKVGNSESFISVIDMQHFCEVARLSTFTVGEIISCAQKAPHGLTVSADGSYLYCNTEFKSDYVCPSILQYDLNELQNSTTVSIIAPQKIYSLPSASSSHNLVIHPSLPNMIYLMAGSQGIGLFDFDKGEVIKFFTPPQAVRGLCSSPKGLLVSGLNILYEVDLELNLIREIGGLNVHQIMYSEVSPDGKLVVAPALLNSQVILIDYHTGSVIKRVCTGLAPLHTTITADSKLAFVTNAWDSCITKINLEDYSTENLKVEKGPNGIANFLIHGPSPRKKKRLAFVSSFSSKQFEDMKNSMDILMNLKWWAENINQKGGLLLEDKSILAAFEIEWTLFDDEADPRRQADIIKSVDGFYDVIIVTKSLQQVHHESNVIYLLQSPPVLQVTEAKIALNEGDIHICLKQNSIGVEANHYHEGELNSLPMFENNFWERFSYKTTTLGQIAYLFGNILKKYMVYGSYLQKFVEDTFLGKLSLEVVSD